MIQHQPPALTKTRQPMVDELLRLEIADAIRVSDASADTDRGICRQLDISLNTDTFTVKHPASGWSSEGDWDYDYEGWHAGMQWHVRVRAYFRKAERVGDVIEATFWAEIR